MGTTSDALLGVVSTGSGAVYLLVTLVEMRAAGGVRAFVRKEAERLGEEEHRVVREIEDEV